MIENITFQKRTSVDRSSLETIAMSADEFNELFSEKLEALSLSLLPSIVCMHALFYTVLAHILQHLDDSILSLVHIYIVRAHYIIIAPLFLFIYALLPVSTHYYLRQALRVMAAKRQRSDDYDLRGPIRTI